MSAVGQDAAKGGAETPAVLTGNEPFATKPDESRARARRGRRGRRRPRQHRLGADPEHPLARASAARVRAGRGDPPVPRAGAFRPALALLLVAPYLAKRRRRAWQAAIVLMFALGLFDLLKGLDFEETIITWTAAIVLILGRDAFRVRHDPITLRSASLARAAARPRRGGRPPRWRPGPRRATRRCEPSRSRRSICCAGSRARSTTTITSPGSRSASTCSSSGPCFAIAYVIFRPLAAPRALPSPEARQVASNLVRAHGDDTLAFFKLRADKHYLFSEDRRAFVGYTIENGVLLLSGDPVGPDDVVRRPAAAGARVRRGSRAEARRARRQPVAVPALRGARAADDLPRRRGGRRARAVLARGPPDPQGPPVGHAV